MDHKTVFVLEHSPGMAANSKSKIDFDLLFKNRPNAESLPAGEGRGEEMHKSLWTCCVEAVCEYCRLVWDVFPRDKLFRFIASHKDITMLNHDWKQDDQNMAKLMEWLAGVGAPSGGGNMDDYSMVGGLVGAVEALCEPSELQLELKRKNKFVDNRGRIIVILNLKNDIMKRTLQETVKQLVAKQRQKQNKSQHWLQLKDIELIFVHVKNDQHVQHVSEHDLMRVDEWVSVESHDVKATRHGVMLANRMLQLVQRHYDLSATSITGIPMKEEQNSSLSQNYDVLLLHQRLPGCKKLAFDWSKADNQLKSTTLLKWRSPKYNPEELYDCIGAARISPVDVNSRPSVCLINFLLNGRCVMLEEWDKQAADDVANAQQQQDDVTIRVTHVITCRGGSIYLHSLQTCNKLIRRTCRTLVSQREQRDRSCDNLRVDEFVSNFVQGFQLHPLDGTAALRKCERSLLVASSYWPLTRLTTTTKSNVPLKLVNILNQEVLSHDEVTSCRNILQNLFKTNQPTPTAETKFHSNKRQREQQGSNNEELWNEVETIVTSYSELTSQHLQVCNFLMQVLGKVQVSEANASSQDSDSQPPNKKFRHASIESPESPEAHLPAQITGRKELNLLQIWKNHMSCGEKKKGFSMTSAVSSTARLYPEIVANQMPVTPTQSFRNNPKSRNSKNWRK